MTFSRRSIAGVLAAALLSGCGGGAQSSLPQQNQHGTGGSGTLAITVRVPGRGATSGGSTGFARHRLSYTSANTQGIGVEFVAHSGGFSGDAAPQYGQAIAPGAPGCDASAGTDGSFNCTTIYVPSVPVGYDDVRVTLWNVAPTGCTTSGSSCSFGAANARALSQWSSLSTSPDGYAIVSGSSNPLAFTLYPIVDSATVTLSAGITDGTAASPAATANLVFKDAQGDVILDGTDPLIDSSGTPLTVTLNIASDLGSVGCNAWNSTPCSLYFNQATQPSFTTAGASGDSVAVNYDGAKNFPSTGASIPQVTIGGLSTIAGTNLPATFSVVGATGSGSVSVPGTPTVSSVDLSSEGIGENGLTIDSSGNVWVVLGNNSGSHGSLVEVSPTTHTILAANTTNLTPGADNVAQAANGNLCVTNNGNAIVQCFTGTTFVNTYTTASDSYGITEGPDGNLWIAEGANVQKLAANGVLSTVSGFAQVFGIVPGPSGTVMAVDDNNADEALINPLSNAVQTFGNPSANGSESAVVGSDGNIWAPDLTDGNVNKIIPGGSSTTYSDGLNSGSDTIAVGPDGNLYLGSGSTDEGITEMTTAGTILKHFIVGPGDSPINQLAYDRVDGRIYAVAFNDNNLYYFTP